MPAPKWEHKDIASARTLRLERATDVERILWRALRNRQLGAKFRRQHIVGSYTLDFACVEHGLAVELDGGQNNDPLQAAHDQRRTLWLNRQGFRVLRFWNNDVLENLPGVLEIIAEMVSTPSPACGRGRGPQSGRVRADGGAASPDVNADCPHPDPLPQAGEGEED